MEHYRVGSEGEGVLVAFQLDRRAFLEPVHEAEEGRRDADIVGLVLYDYGGVCVHQGELALDLDGFRLHDRRSRPGAAGTRAPALGGNGRGRHAMANTTITARFI